MYIDNTTFWVVVSTIIVAGIWGFIRLKNKINFLGEGISHLYILVLAMCQDANIYIDKEGKERLSELAKFYKQFGDKTTPPFKEDGAPES